MGLRSFWRAHPWACGWIALVGGIVAIIGALAVSVHLRGYARLRAVVAEQRAAGIGSGPQDYLARAPDLDAGLQARAWQLFGMKAPGWSGWKDDISKHFRLVLPAGAGWHPSDGDRALLAAARPMAESMRSLLRDERLVLSIAGWIRQDLDEGKAVDAYRIHSLLRSESLKYWLALASVYGDVEAEADLRRMRRALAIAPSLFDLSVAMGVQSVIGDLRLARAARGELSLEQALETDPEAIGSPEQIRAALATERLLYVDRAADDVLAGRPWPKAGIDDAAYHDRTGLIDWLRGAGDLASTIDRESRLERGLSCEQLPSHWIDLRSRFDPRSTVPDLEMVQRGMRKRLRRCSLVHAATILVAAGRGGNLPADERSARRVVGPGWPSEPAVGYTRDPHGFTLGSPEPVLGAMVKPMILVTTSGIRVDLTDTGAH